MKFFKEDFPAIKHFLRLQEEQGKKILPMSVGHRFNIFNAFLLTPFKNVKVVILGQDPYPNEEHAMGLAFSVPSDVTSLPGSLRNIYKELEDDLGIVRTKGSLADWAKQGVLLLNTALTVEANKPGSHSNIGWEKLTQETIRSLSRDKDGLVFILWGNKAQAYKRFITNRDSHMIIESAHPSPLSVHKGFFGSKPFSRTNAYLESVGKEPIKW